MFHMFLPDHELIQKTIRQLGLSDTDSLKLTPILKGGSDRRFLRATWNKGSCIVMEYGLEREENRLYADIGKFLESLKIDVPRILGAEAESHLLWVEDLGADDLWAYRDQPWEARAPLYRSVLEQVNHLHEHGLTKAETNLLKTMPGFDCTLYQWERDYFYDKFILRACGLELSAAQKEELENSLKPLALALTQGRQSLVHRDFQSQNIMVRNGYTFLIDFQGLRSGVSAYDLASLLYDPYVNLNSTERSELLDFCYVLPGWRPQRELYDQTFYTAAVQRLMQALGAYGFLGLEKEKPAFLKHIKPALANLELVVQKLPQMDALKNLLHLAKERVVTNLIQKDVTL